MYKKTVSISFKKLCIKLLYNRKDSFKKSGFLRFYLYFCHVIQSSICF